MAPTGSSQRALGTGAIVFAPGHVFNPKQDRYEFRRFTSNQNIEKRREIQSNYVVKTKTHQIQSYHAIEKGVKSNQKIQISIQMKSNRGLIFAHPCASRVLI